MSTSVYLYCLDHTPYIGSYGEVEQHIGGAYSDNIARFIANRERLANVDLWDALQGHENQFERNAASFFHGHPTCRVGVKDEYGRWHEFPGAHLPEEERREKVKKAFEESLDDFRAAFEALAAFDSETS